MPGAHRLAPRLALIALGLLLGAGALEAGLRVSDRWQDAGSRHGLHELRPDRAWLYGMRPNAVGQYAETGGVVYRVNGDGFRDAPRAHAKPPGAFRILVLGDSIAFGHGVDAADTFPADMERALTERAPSLRAEVLNLGVSGYNPWTEARLLEDVGPLYQPDLVLAQFCINDLNDPTLHFDVHARFQLGDIPDGAFPDPAKRRAPPSLSAFGRVCRQSRLCALLDGRLLAWTSGDPDAEAQRAAATPIEAPGPEWDWLAARYAEMAAESQKLGARFAVIAFPYAAQLGRQRPEYVQQRLVGIGEQGGWPTIELLRDFRRAARDDPKQALFLDWWHPTPRGHHVAADATLAALACDGLLPAEARVLCPAGAEAAAPGH